MRNLTQIISGHRHSHNRNHERNTHENKHFPQFTFVETPHKKGKKGKLYIVSDSKKVSYAPKPIKKQPNYEDPYFPILSQDNIEDYKKSGEEICPYIRNPIINKHAERIYGVCALSGEQCMGHTAYACGKIDCLEYADFWNPRKIFTKKIPLRFNSEMFKDSYLTPILPKTKE